jgi:hypothetical protein
MISFIVNFLIFFTICTNAYAGGFIVSALISEAFAATVAGQVLAFAINMVASSIISKVFAPDLPNQGAQQALPNPGNPQQLPPAGDNKLPVVYGTGYVGGIITDLSITSNNQTIYWVFALSEVTNTETGGTPDTFTFGNIYWGGKLCIFSTSDATQVTGLKDESTGVIQDVTGYMNIYLYKNGSSNPVNTSSSAITVMSASDLVYKWDSTKLMSNTAFAIIKLTYNSDRNLTSLNQTRFQLTNSRKAPGDCIYDYLTSTRYGAALETTQIDTTSITALNTYSNQTITYYPYSGGTAIQKRFEFNGVLDTSTKIMPNIQMMADCCDSLIKYNEITGLWGVIVQTPTYTVSMDLNDSNIVSAITVTPIDLSNSFNIVEVRFPDGSAKDSFASATYDLAVIDPSLLFPNEPVNKQSVNLNLVNSSVTSQYIANRFLKAAREDLQIQLDIDYTGLQLEAGDIVTVTNANYGWVAKLFRISKVTEKFSDSGQVTATLSLMEYNPAVYNDYSVTQFTPAPNTGIGSATAFGTVPTPVVATSYPSNAIPSIFIQATTSSAGITQYAEIWYSAYQYPTTAQLIFGGTTIINANGNPYDVNTVMPSVELGGLPAGNYYFFSRMVNSLAKSSYSSASTVFNWKPLTFQYTNRYLAVAYADDAIGTGFTFNPRGKSYYGLANQTSNTASSVVADYQWYLANPVFSTNKFLVYTNRTNRKFSFATDSAAYAAGTASFVPTSTSTYDPSLWSGLIDGTNIIDLDMRTGQVISTGTTTTGAGQVSIVNTADGQVVAALQQFLDFGGPTTYTTASVASLTIDIYGRVVGFTSIDNFFMTISQFTATSGQTVFSVTRNATYIKDQCLVFSNGALLATSEYTDTAGATGTVTLATGALTGTNITIISMRAISSAVYYNNVHINVLSVASNVVTWNSATMPYETIDVGDIITFANTGTPTQYTVTGVNYATQQITFSTTVTGVTAGAGIYFYRAASSSYQVFSRYTSTVTNAASYTPTTWNFETGYELPFLNGVAINANDYNLAGNTYTSTPNLMTGALDIIQFTGNNVTLPTGNYVNVVTYTVNGQTSYSFNSIANAFDLFMNGMLLVNGTDYTSTTSSYTLTNTPANNTTVLQQQTFARYGAA